MAHMLFPVAGRSKEVKRDEFSFFAVREVKNPKCRAYECENIPTYLYDYKYTDYSKEEPCYQNQQQQQQRPHQQHPRLQHHNLTRFPTNCAANTVTSHQPRDFSKTADDCPCHMDLYPTVANMSIHPQHFRPDGSMSGDMKKLNIPMSNCQPLCCSGTRCACLAPEHAQWGYTRHDLSTCAWQQGVATSKMRIPDPQVVRPHDKSLPDDRRPTGHPYFNHGMQTCPPHEAPSANEKGFNFEQWLATVPDREPPAHLRNKCISSMCTMCGPRTIECCPDYQCPENYLLAQKSAPR